MAIWRPISAEPNAPIMVELFYGKLVLRDQHGVEVPLTTWRDFRRSLGFWDGKRWCELNTGHDVFEDWLTEEQLPTHYRALPQPPEL